MRPYDYDYSRHYDRARRKPLTPQKKPEREPAFGDIFTYHITFAEKNGGKKRPTLVYQYKPDSEYCTVFKITKQIEKTFSQKYGYLIQNWSDYGLRRPSAIIMHPKNLYRVPKRSLKKYIGTLSDKEKIGTLEKWIDNEKHIQATIDSKKRISPSKQAANPPEKENDGPEL